MKTFISTLLIFLLSSCSSTDLKHFANDFKLIAETESSAPTLSIRLLTLRDFGECFEKKCPQEQLYIAISEYGEAPEQNLYLSYKADSWEFLSWESLPQLGTYPYSVKFTVKVVENNIEYNQEIEVSLETINYLEKIKIIG